MKYIEITHSDKGIGYLQLIEDLPQAINGEFDGFEEMLPGDKVILTIVEMSEEDYKELPTFAGW